MRSYDLINAGLDAVCNAEQTWTLTRLLKDTDGNGPLSVRGLDVLYHKFGRSCDGDIC